MKAEIDQLVFSLYGLTPDEIRIVEESVTEKTAGWEVAEDSALEQET